MSFFYHQLFTKLPYPTADHSSQTIIVTGSNVGLGLEAARHFTRLNAAKVILAVRTVEKGEAAKRSIEESTQRQGVVEVWQLDLANYDSVKDFARRANNLKRLDALVNNAGIATDKYKLTEDNESTITTNVVSTFLLSLLLLPKLRQTGATYNITPHLAVVSSEVHGWAKFEERKSDDIFKSLNDKESANMKERYPTSKLLEVYYVRELVAQAKASGKSEVIVNLINPGLCHSELARDSGWILWLMKLLLARTTEMGSRSLVHAVEARSDTDGQYLSNCLVEEPHPIVTQNDGPKTQKRVYDELNRKLEAIQPGLIANV